jgi:hypothetical protein
LTGRFNRTPLRVESNTSVSQIAQMEKRLFIKAPGVDDSSCEFLYDYPIARRSSKSQFKFFAVPASPVSGLPISVWRVQV